jgi:hypothetical protein
VVAELLALAVGDGELRAELRERGAAQAAQFTPQRSAQALRGALEGLPR